MTNNEQKFDLSARTLLFSKNGVKIKTEENDKVLKTK